MQEYLENSNFKLMQELELVCEKLAVAKQGLKLVADNAGSHIKDIATKTLQEIDTM